MKYTDILTPTQLTEADLYLRGQKKFQNLSATTQEAIARGYKTLGFVHEDGGRNRPFQERMKPEDVHAAIGGDAEVIEEGYNRMHTNELTQRLMDRVGTDADRPADTSPLTLSEIIEASYDTLEGTK